ncbi:Fic family protein [Loktanella sp. Alg231-35]|uniref:Fic family protein n=1 Tax=Loktanella sp. Alg231-35 TaxID=1922220 RepID=UPI000D55F929|nr:Fic family protein [Loktanella sp. Alg231-35]
MASPNEKLAASLELLKERQAEHGNVLRSSELTRTHRERLKKNGFLSDVILGWLIVTRPQDKPHDSTFWYTSFWDFCRRYCHERYGLEWCFSSEQSLLLHAESTHIPKQVIVWTPKGSGNNTVLPFDTSLYDLKKDLPPKSDIATKDGLLVLSVEAALINVPEAFYRSYAMEAQIVLSGLKNTGPLLVKLLDGGHVLAAGRIAGALRRVGRDSEAETILKKMKAADYDVRERDPFADVAQVMPLEVGSSPLAARINAAWDTHRDAIVEIFPDEPGMPDDKDAFLAMIDDIYVNDAYHSLSIEGYSVTEELIEQVRQGSFDPLGNAEHRKDVDALAASGYWQAFQAVRASIEKILYGEPAGQVVRLDHDAWFEELFRPSVTAGILKAGALAGYRNHPVYLRGSRHTPPRVEAIASGMATLFERLENEDSTAVRAVLGHWLLGYVHPYPDGNGRMARFLMNAMFASGGYSWTVIDVDHRAAYMSALECASVGGDIVPFARLVEDRMRWSGSLATHQN